MATAFGEVSVANETPLMFSRSSSLGSLSSLDQQAALNAHNLAVNHSQHTSGAVSPSDLPDSPSQTMPPSPRRRSPEPAFQLPPCTKPMPQPVGGVFQDCPRSFAEEGTPCRISQATSLSSLTLDDDTGNIEKLLGHGDEQNAFRRSSFGRDGGEQAQFANGAYFGRKHVREQSHLQSSGVTGIEEGAAEVFADTTRRYAQEGTPRGYSRPESPCSMTNESSCPQNGIGCDWDDDFEMRPHQAKHPVPFGSSRGRRWSGERVHKSHVTNKHVSFNDDCVMRTSHEDAAVPYFAEDCVRVYCTEGTPSVLSHAPSLNDLGSTKAWMNPQGSGGQALEVSPESCRRDGPQNSQSSAKSQGCHKHVSFNEDCHLQSQHEAASPSFEEDCLRVYCTEDTPSVLSHSASFTDLSISHDGSKNWDSAEQSLKTPCIKREALIDVSDEEEGSADLIVQCIQLGWQVSQSSSSHPKARSWNGLPEDSITINAPIPKPRSRNSTPGKTASVTSKLSCSSPLPSSHSPCQSKQHCVSQDTVSPNADVPSYKFGVISSSNLAERSPSELTWKSNTFGNVVELNSGLRGLSITAQSSAGDIGRPHYTEPIRPNGCLQRKDDVCGGLVQEPPLREDSSDEENDVQLLQEVVMMGRALAVNSELPTSPNKNLPETPLRSEPYPQCPSSSMPSIPVSSPLKPHHYDQDPHHTIISSCTKVKGNSIEMPVTSPSHVRSKSESRTFRDKNEYLSESSDEEQDSKILLEVISLGRAVVSKQQHCSDESTKQGAEHVRENIFDCQDTVSPVTAEDCSCATTDDGLLNKEHPVPVCVQPDVEDCLIQDDDDDDGKLLEEVIMLGLSSVQNVALNLPPPSLSKQSITVPTKETPISVLCAEDTARTTSGDDTTHEPVQERVCAIVCKDGNLEEERKDKHELRAITPLPTFTFLQPSLPPEPPADSSDRVVQIRLKLPTGRTLTRRFLASAELGVLLVYLDSLGYPVTRFKILKNWRRQELATVNPKQTLEQLKLYPKKTLTIKER
ncbi:hypothetical protein V5799_027960 [Amblyomma americanum]|uniref:UBX domain-containing protein n=1 Tax=Amblyomma americanum TaxID=6943 RepID=A0AAQ4DE78_AMBAM